MISAKFNQAFAGHKLALVSSFLLGLILMPVAAPMLGRYIDMVFPVTTNWRPDGIQRDGNDLVVIGTMIKRRDCVYVPPPRARTESGVNLVIQSLAPASSVTYMADDKPQRFGPWRIVGGAKQRLTLYQHHSCHALWDTLTELGEINDAGTP